MLTERTAVKMYTAIFLLTLLSISRVQAEGQTEGQTEGHKEVCGTITVTCLCGFGMSSNKFTLELEIYMTKDSQTGKIVCGGVPNSYKGCADSTCLLADISPLRPVKKAGDTGKELNAVEKSTIPEEFTILRGDLPSGHRFTRETEPCHVTPSKKAMIKCTKWPHFIKCNISCMYGYDILIADKRVNSTNVHCNTSDNVWKPNGFPECQISAPVNCWAHLIGPGEMECKERFAEPPYCDISCLDYDDNEATPLQRYECHDEHFAEKLPHCAVLRDDDELSDYSDDTE